MSEGTILVVDDSADTREVLRRNLEREGYEVHTASGVESGLALLAGTAVDIVITDVKMPRVSGIDLVRHVRDNLKGMEVIVITGFPDVNGAVSAMKHGAVDYLPKPFTDEELLGVVGESMARLRARRVDADESGSSAQHGLLGDSPQLDKVRSQIWQAARSKATVLISGESGTGKELVARAIHYESARASAPFVPVNCGAIPGELLESELFGHVKGSFTGAAETRAGFFLVADGGTLFLDEIGETSVAMQVKLLRVLQDGEIRMVGATKPRTVDVRVVAATNKELAQLVQKGSFREDLFFRINVLNVHVPPLRERGSDVALLANHFAQRYAAELDRPPPRLSDRALEALMSHSWPGNVRELENLVQRLVLTVEGDVVEASDLPSLMRFSASGSPDLSRSLAEVEAEYVRLVLESVGGNKTRAAEILGVDRKTLRGQASGPVESAFRDCRSAGALQLHARRSQRRHPMSPATARLGRGSGAGLAHETGRNQVSRETSSDERRFPWPDDP